MLDCRGKLLKAGDTVAVAAYGRQVVGTLEIDPDDIRYVRLQIRVNPNKIRYYDAVSARILNITAMTQEQLDSPQVVVLQ